MLRGHQWKPAANDKALRVARRSQRSHAPGQGGGFPAEASAPGVALYLFLQQRGFEDPVGGACQSEPERRPEARQQDEGLFPECVARVPVSLWGSGSRGCVRSTLPNRPQPAATVRNVRNPLQPSATVRRSQPFATVCARSLWPCLW